MREEIRKDWIILCDANCGQGLGHLSRCLGIAEALKDIKQECIFHGNYNSIAKHMVNESGFNYTYANPIDKQVWNKSKIHSLGRNIILDNYLAAEEEISLLSEYIEPGRCVVMDDFGRLGKYDCHAVINFTIGAESIHKILKPYRKKCTFYNDNANY